jgi:hypothetical protein
MTRATRRGGKSRTPLGLNSEARNFLRAHEAHRAAEEAFRTAVAVEEARDPERNDFSPATRALSKELLASRRRMTQMGDAIATRSEQRRKPALADCLLLALASWHSNKARGACCLALLSVAGIDMDDGSPAARGLDL